MRLINRRTFLKLSALFTWVPFFFRPSRLKKQIYLKSNSIHRVLQDQELLLPEKARPGDNIYLIIPSSSLPHPSRIISSTRVPIMGHRELTLDTLSNIRISFRGRHRGWINC